ncbi:glycosyltransferase family 39 protein [Acidovorax sp. NCPPB 2350]|nr:glycosyltransferase family 39 protein [Acidovorax sp. NCPPB 2350]
MAFLWLACFVGARPLLLPDEGRYAGVAWEMLASGDWRTPTLAGLPFFHKPPLFYWTSAAAMRVLGLHEIAARVAPLLGATLAGAALFLFVRRWRSERMARVGLAVLSLQPMFYLGAQFANHDMLVAGCITATILLLAHAALLPDGAKPPPGVRIGIGAAAALGVLSKGLIGLVLPALVIGLWVVATRRWRCLPRLLSPLALVSFVAVAAPWFIAMQWRFEGFSHYFFVVQHFQRYAAGGFNNAQPFWFFPAVLALASLPWLYWLGPIASGRYFREPGRGEVRLLMLIWVLAVVLFFSLPRSKLVGYVLPALPPLAFLVADGLSIVLARHPRRVCWVWAGAAVSVLACLAPVFILSLHPAFSHRELGRLIARERRPGEPVYFLQAYPYDIPFYARLEQPARVVEDWASPTVRQRDNWRKELAEAADFAAAEVGANLIAPADFRRAACQPGVRWVVGPEDAAAAYRVLERARRMASVRGMAVWRFDVPGEGAAGGAPCPGTPSDGRARK